MATIAKITWEGVEVLAPSEPNAEVAWVGVEVLVPNTIQGGVSWIALEVLAPVPPRLLEPQYYHLRQAVNSRGRL